MKPNLVESVASPIHKDTRIDPDRGVLSGLCVFRPVSLNNRVYSKKAQESLLKLADNAKSYMDHGIFGSSVKDLVGKFHSPRMAEDGAIYADLKVLKSSDAYSKIFEVATEMPDLAGFSINAKGKFADSNDEHGREQVEDVLRLYSIDWVGDPATTSGMYEDNKGKDTGGDLKMKKVVEYLMDKIRTIGLTEDGIENAVIQYIKNLEQEKESLTSATVQLTEERKEVDKKVKEFEASLEELKSVKAKLQNYEDAENQKKALKAREDLIAKVLEEEKLPADKISKEFNEILMELGGEKVEDRIRALVKERKKMLEPVMDKTMGDEQKNTKAGDTVLSDEEARKKLHEAMK